MVVISVHIHGVDMIKKIPWESVFLGGSMEPPWHQREWKYLGHLSVKEIREPFE